jgi:hypothetical protein
MTLGVNSLETLPIYRADQAYKNKQKNKQRKYGQPIQKSLQYQP